MQEANAKDLLLRMLKAAIAAADPGVVLPPYLPEKPAGRCIVIGAGKSAGRHGTGDRSCMAGCQSHRNGSDALTAMR